MSIKRIILSILVILFGIFMFVYAGIDNSPGGQLIGMIVVIGTVLNLIKGYKRTR